MDDVMFVDNRTGKGNANRAYTQSDAPGAAKIRYGRKYNVAFVDGSTSDVYDYLILLLGSHSVSVRALCNGRRVCHLSVCPASYLEN